MKQVDKSMPWIMMQRDEYIVEGKVHNSRVVNLVFEVILIQMCHFS